MADTEVKDDEEELIIIEEPPKEEVVTVPDDKGGGEDERLAESQSDTDAEVTDRGAAGETDEEKRERRRREKRQRTANRRQAAYADKQEIAALRSRLDQQSAEIAALRGGMINSSEAGLDERIAAKENEVAHFEAILSAAVEARNGGDVAAALRYRDEARDSLVELKGQKQQFTAYRENPPPAQVDPALVEHAQAWHRANPWYQPNGEDEDSLIARAVSTSLVKEGYDPRSKDHWVELTERLRERFGEEDGFEPHKPPPSRSNGRSADPPPVGVNRGDNVSAAARKNNQVYVSPERVAAIKEMGIWDDVKARNEMIRYYQKFDQENPDLNKK